MKQQDTNSARLMETALPANWERFGMAGKKQGEAGAGAPKRRGHVGLAFDPIAAALRQMHDEVASEDIPDDFLKLLDEIDDRVKARKPAK